MILSRLAIGKSDSEVASFRGSFCRVRDHKRAREIPSPSNSANSHDKLMFLGSQSANPKVCTIIKHCIAFVRRDITTVLLPAKALAKALELESFAIIYF